MQNRILTILFLFATILSALAEEERSYSELEEVEVYGEQQHQLSDFSEAAHYQADTLLINNQRHSSLADFIAQHTPYVVKQNGNGMMTTLSLRGTSASHTQALWDDINISPLTMGQTDYSTLPIFFFDGIDIFPGGESALFGNAIGGAVSLSSKNDFTQRRSLILQQDLGSYGKSFSGIKLNLGNSIIQNRTSIFYNRCENNFTVHFRDEIFRQKNASYNNYGALNETEWRVNSKHLIGAKLWFTKYNRELQPMMQNNDDPSKYEQIDDQSAKAILFHELNGKWLHLRNKVAWVNDREHFQGDLIATHDLMLLSNARRRFKRVMIEVGGELHYIKPEVYAYKSGVEEWRGAIFLLSKFTPCQWLSLHGNLRQSFVTSMGIPFSPAFGFEAKPFSQERFVWALGGNIARNTKVPTLNDRYWGDYANKQLTAESAFNLEAKSRWELRLKRYKGNLSATLYRNDVDNWIMWMPRGVVWKPTNIEEVLARGVEVESRHSFPISKLENSLSFSFNHSFTEIQKGFQNMHPFLGHQMPLTPQNTFAGFWNIRFKETDLTVSGNYTGERTSSDIFDVLEGYFLMDLSINHTFSFPKKSGSKAKQQITVTLQINNLLDKEYQNLPFRGMPGRNFLAGAKWRIDSK